jgi:hypothetical protein
MGRLKPGATYIYERVGSIVYQREEGSLEREAIGWDYEDHSTRAQKELEDARLWREIREDAKNNQVLQEALDRVILLYHLGRRDGQK